MDVIVQFIGRWFVRTTPGQAREALAAIKKICDDGLTDVKTILGIPRDDTSTAGATRAAACAPGRAPAHRAARHGRGGRLANGAASEVMLAGHDCHGADASAEAVPSRAPLPA